MSAAESQMIVPSEHSAQSAPSSDETDTALQQLGRAMISGAAAVREGAKDARTKAKEMAPMVGESVGKAVYTTCYYLSYGVVFPSMFVAGLLPLDNALGYGIIDGAAAAKEAVARMRARRMERRHASVPRIEGALGTSGA